MAQNNYLFPEKSEPGNIEGTTDNAAQREKYLRDAGKIEDFPETEPVAKMKSAISKKEDPVIDEGHTREWQDRARVVIDSKESLNEYASPNQSPANTGDQEEVEEKGQHLREKNNQNY
ncbi:MAG: hypothetical protein ABI415_00675 [Flavitalea sp.]